MLTKEQKNIYMKHYIAHCPKYECLICNSKVKKCYVYKHNKSKKHKMLEEFINGFKNTD
jgi:hypothetical protein